MHAMHDYLSDRLQEKLEERRVVVWYDTNEEFGPFLEELPAAEMEGELPALQIGDLRVRFKRFEGSFFGVRAAVEPFVCVDVPDLLLIYIPGEKRDPTGSILMELEKAGECYEPQLKRHARRVLGQFLTVGEIDEILAPDSLTYVDVVSVLDQIEQDDQKASLLRAAFPGTRDDDALLARWLTDASKDDYLTEKQAIPELRKLIQSRLGIEIDGDCALEEVRSRTARYVLVNEFREDLDGEPPSSIGLVPLATTADQMSWIEDVAAQLRARHPDEYEELADQVAADLRLADAEIDASDLGSTDTFRFEERLLLKLAGEFSARKNYRGALEIIEGRGSSFWVDRDVGRQAQWEACRLISELGTHVEDITPQIAEMGDDAGEWVKAYAGKEGWYQVDLTHRTLESWITKMDGEIETERALALVRSEYDELLRKMGLGFSRALQSSGWSVSDCLSQTEVFRHFIEPRRSPVAYFLVDSMRFEMGVELVRQLDEPNALFPQPAVAALPTVTPVGMAALLPEASRSFAVVEHGEDVAGSVEGTSLPGLQGRRKYLQAVVPDCADMTIGQLLRSTHKKLQERISEASLIVVRSQEIDRLGEEGDDWLARQTMDSTVGNLARAVKKLAAIGIANFVITSDHGHQFSSRKEEDMRMDKPGGDTVAIHRRCWIGRGGQTPPGTVRVTGAELGYDTDLDFIFPMGTGVFRTAGGLSYHHGGCSLQELVIPVIDLRLAPREEEQQRGQIILADCPNKIVNRAFAVVIEVPAGLFSEETLTLRPLILAGEKYAGEAGMAHPEGSFNRETKCLRVKPGEKVTVGMILTKDDYKKVRVVVQDPSTDAVLAETDEIPVSLGI